MTAKSTPKASASARISRAAKQLAEQRCAEQGQRLTPARLGAYAELLAAKGAVTAYELIDRLEQRQGKKIAPLTVYRHLDFLTRVGLVHRIESTQSYLPCDHPHDHHESQYLLCSDCGYVEEVHSSTVETAVESIASKRGFRPTRAVVEVSGLCADCDDS